MKDFASKFYQTLVLNVATISAIVVGIVQFAVRAFNENNGKDKVKDITSKTLSLLDQLIDVAQKNINDVPVAEVSTKSTKRVRKVQ